MTLKAFWCSDCDLYAAESAEQAAALFKDDTRDACDDGYPREMTDAELDKPQQSFDEDERPIEGEFTSVRQMLAEHGLSPGWLAGTVW